jgi:hypothetical protein
MERYRLRRRARADAEAVNAQVVREETLREDDREYHELQRETQQRLKDLRLLQRQRQTRERRSFVAGEDRRSSGSPRREETEHVHLNIARQQVAEQARRNEEQRRRLELQQQRMQRERQELQAVRQRLAAEQKEAKTRDPQREKGRRSTRTAANHGRTELFMDQMASTLPQNPRIGVYHDGPGAAAMPPPPPPAQHSIPPILDDVPPPPPQSYGYHTLQRAPVFYVHDPVTARRTVSGYSRPRRPAKRSLRIARVAEG